MCPDPNATDPQTTVRQASTHILIFNFHHTSPQPRPRAEQHYRNWLVCGWVQAGAELFGIRAAVLQRRDRFWLCLNLRSTGYTLIHCISWWARQFYPSERVYLWFHWVPTVVICHSQFCGQSQSSQPYVKIR